MKIQEIRKLKSEDLQKELEVLRKELLESKREIRDGKEKDVKKSLRIKRIIARIQTVLNTKEEKNEKNK